MQTRFIYFQSPPRGMGPKPKKKDTNFLKEIKSTPGLLIREFKKLNKWIQHRHHDMFTPNHLMYEYIAKFRDMSPTEMEEWLVTTDEQDGGLTTANVTKHPKRGTLIFSGNLDTTVPKVGDIVRSGLASFRSPHNVIFGLFVSNYYNRFNSVVIRYRGDGRTYSFNFQTNYALDLFWHDFYVFPIYTKGGPMWQTARIPFHKFMKVAGGRLQDVQEPLPSDKIRHISFSLMDRVTGPFCFEIDYIALMRHDGQNDEFSYEMYNSSSKSQRYK